MRSIRCLALAIIFALLSFLRQIHRIAVFEQSAIEHAELDFHVVLKSGFVRRVANKTTLLVPNQESFLMNDSVKLGYALYELPRTEEIHEAKNNYSRCNIMHEWFQQDYLRNIETNNLGTDQSVMVHNPLKVIDDLLGETLCHEGGTFRSTQLGVWNVSNTEKLHEWEFKLTYLALYDLLHRPAREEHHERAHCDQIFPMNDFQCAGSKFLVTNLANLGMGAALRLGAVTHILTAIAVDRVPLFVSNTSTGPEHLRTPWNLVSCERKDFQCVFLPITPCTISNLDLENAIAMNRSDVAAMRRDGIIPDGLAHFKVLAVDGLITPAKADSNGIHQRVQQKIYDRALQVIEEWRVSKQYPYDEMRHEFLQAAAGRIRESKEAVEPLYYDYGHRNYRIAHAILIYLLRPNTKKKSTVDHNLRKVLSSQFKPENTIGMPIRASDKCQSESTCLNFDQYMQLAKESWEAIKTHPDAYGTLIMTTEDEDVFRRHVLYNRTVGFPLDIVVNEGDSLQGSGNVDKFGLDADDIIISSLVAIRMQLHAGHVYGNCCSNFHLMIFDFVREGCGLTSRATCLQETEKYKVCCEWSKGEECDSIRKEYWKSNETPQQIALREALQLLANYRRNNVPSLH